MSHDLRGPLANIKAAATSVLSGEVEWSDEDVRCFCTTIDVEADRLTALVSNLLDMGRLQTGMLGVKIEPVLIDQAVFGALASLGIENTDGIAVDLPAELPPAAADPPLLERALANVISNARDWSPPGTPVRITAGLAAGQLDIRVIDRGIGIPPAQRAAVFRPFQRLGDGGRASYDGVGLGLAVTKGLVEAMDGAVAIEDTPSGGTTMVITLEVGS